MLAILGTIIMVGGLIAIPFGFPGLWVMVAVLAVGWWLGAVGWLILALALVLAAAAELIEYYIIDRMNIRYGGSRLAFWGAILGGIAGIIIGLPVPILGSVIAGFIGSFVGAALATLYQTRHVEHAARVGWGTLLGRLWASVAKVAAGVIILVLGSAALIF
ncbi:MAG TPA: DUF456 family protein [Longimicrobiales bacterium]|nr:DUF456 family protein [Longimicrobiales bacterium]